MLEAVSSIYDRLDHLAVIIADNDYNNIIEWLGNLDNLKSKYSSIDIRCHSEIDEIMLCVGIQNHKKRLPACLEHNN